ncbi:MAG TPA: hypothetical protein DER15_01300 [Clostridiales bacterium]|jgi:transcriptional regulator with XRE-family HTH domain|nr:hypothetical protein [Clostridiales bacterium]
MIYMKMSILKMGDFMKVKILLREVRLKKNITLETLARLSGISKGHLSKIERQEREPKISTLIQIAIALNVDVKELYKVIL